MAGNTVLIAEIASAPPSSAADAKSANEMAPTASFAIMVTWTNASHALTNGSQFFRVESVSPRTPRHKDT